MHRIVVRSKWTRTCKELNKISKIKQYILYRTLNLLIQPNRFSFTQVTRSAEVHKPRPVALPKNTILDPAPSSSCFITLL